MTESQRLKVRPEVFFVRAPEGVWLRNNIGSFFIKGPRYYELVRTLFTAFDGTRTVRDVLGRFDARERAILIQRLIEPLTQRGFLARVPDEPERVPERLRQHYAEHLAFLEQYVERPAARLLDIRGTPIACVGSGLLLRSAVVAAAELAFARVHVVATDTGVDADSLRALVASASEHDEGSEWVLRFCAPGSPHSELAHALPDLPGTSVVVGVAAPAREALADMVEALQQRGHRVVVVATVGGFAIASPIFDADTRWCWGCIHRSIPSSDALLPAPPSAALAAFQATQRLFCRSAGPPVPVDHALTLVDARTLTITTCAPRRHEMCQRHPRVALAGAHSLDSADDLVRPDVPTSRDSEALIEAQDRIVAVVSGWVHGTTGPLLSVGEEELEQVPLAASRCRVALPLDRAGASAAASVECRAVSAREARNQAVLFALERLATSVHGAGNDAARPLVFGAGWCPAEAAYRALARVARERLADPLLERHTVARGRWPPSPLRTLLLEVLDTRPVEDLHARLARLPTALVGVELVAGDRLLGRGVGIDAAHALDHALLAALCADSRWSGEIGHPAPRLRRWSEVMARLRRRASSHPPLLDASGLLPFLYGGASLVAVPEEEHP